MMALLTLLILPVAVAGEPLPKAPKLDESNFDKQIGEIGNEAAIRKNMHATPTCLETPRLPVKLPTLMSVDSLGEHFLKLIPPEIVTFIRDLNEKEKEEIVRWAQDYSITDDADGGSDMTRTMPEFQKKFTPLKWIVGNLTEAVAASDDAKYFVSSLLETVCHIFAIYLDGEEIEPEYLKFMMRQLDRTHVSLTLESKKLLDDRGKIIKDVMNYPEFNDLFNSWMLAPPIKDSVYPTKEDYGPFEVNEQMENNEDEEEVVIVLFLIISVPIACVKTDAPSTKAILKETTTPIITPIPIKLPNLRNVDALGEDFLKLIPDDFINVIRNLTDNEKETIVIWANDYAITNEDAGGMSQLERTHSSLTQEIKKLLEDKGKIIVDVMDACTADKGFRLPD
ncbi:hypothetical protein PRIPAC_92741 [Pristionchus pacificus]|uniref:Uncharacterized protein n=1 Tax=Pristionchus pacificus TaxID=54126 RepID=A0A2A6BAC5_PRIPA|nr:hypothetical protein PRIPAC_92741 [Pristionchus pacificus]|eukprot:PDM62830.1 hypothetical protein PRIPAC_50045 [Pristionchus pacificus]